MSYSGLMDLLSDVSGFRKTVESIQNGQTPVHLTGVSAAAAAHLVFCIQKNRKTNGRVFVITPDGLSAKTFAGDLEVFSKEKAYVFPEREMVFYDVDAVSDDISAERLALLEKIKTNEAKFVTASVSAALCHTAPESLFSEILTLKEGDACDTKEIEEKLVLLGYTRESMVEGKGQFSVRGGIIDFYSHTAENAVRIEIVYDEVDSIREFDIYTQRSLERLKEVSASPARELIISQEIKEKLLEIAVNSRDKERLENDVYFPSVERYLPFIYEKTPTIFDYMEKDDLVVLWESESIKKYADTDGERIARQIEQFSEKGIIPQTEKEWRLPYADMITSVLKFNVLSLSRDISRVSDFLPERIENLACRNQTPFYGKMDFFSDAVKFYKKNKYKTIIFSGSEKRAVNTAELLESEGISALYTKEVPSDIPKESVLIIEGSISEGFEYTADKIAVISDKEVFGSDRRKRKVKHMKNQERIKSYTDLNVGDYVIHQEHGVGMFAGIKTMEVEGAVGDYIHICFRGSDAIYVPATNLDLIYKYTSKEGMAVKLNKLGGTEWLKTKQKVKKGAAEMASQLLKLYAERKSAEGIAFSPDSEWHGDFAAKFPYEETDDQLRCIDEVREDMEKPYPMDRLLCGDVGYGKTEVALRAAFKAVADGYQVAYLVPTTILANQHYNTFKERMSDFPITVHMLSRFCSKKEQAETVKKAERGEVDVIIGTHRLIQKDVKFKKLGLLIIDEEQRFGVAHKEQLKELKKSVDVLTLSATPIPRTLHMSMVGIRDMSVLENPPKNRYPVNTFVSEYDEETVKYAILREMARGGQVYYLHNRVDNIERTASRIAEFAPGIRVGVAHGKMSEVQLENIMNKVLNKEIDVLICTTIIETGLDIPNVNTIIVEEADRFGLSQLYQLRGRVGRSDRLAYAYFTYSRGKEINEVAQKRLRAIRDFAEFGSGFKIALRDLEIRGAGNVIGAEQHGHMDIVGYDMYCKLLEEAVTELNGKTITPEIQTVVSLEVDAYIPKKYIIGDNFRMEAYKKISHIKSEQDYFDVYDELEDRYGPLPRVAENLMEVALIRSVARELGIEEIKKKQDGIVFVYAENSGLKPEHVLGLIAQNRDVKFSPSAKPYITLKVKGGKILQNVKNMLQQYKQLQNE